jgi:alkylation response protein AidB-like acyl-CoA dehydrogenase
MLDYTYSEEQVMFKNALRDYVEKSVKPTAEAFDKEAHFPREMWSEMGKLGFLAPSIPAEYNGGGIGFVATAIAIEELSVGSVSIGAFTLEASTMYGADVWHGGTEEQKQKYLSPVCAGERVGALAITEPASGSDAIGSMQATGVRKGDYYYLSGEKTFNSLATESDYDLVFVKTAPEKRAHGISAFIVDKGFPGFKPGKPFEKLGFRAIPTGPCYLDDCRVPVENLLGKENEGARIMMGGLNAERVGIAAICVGGARDAFERALSYTKERVAFGQPIIKFQLMQAMLADMATDLEAARQLVLRAAWALDRFGEGREQDLVCSHAKVYATEMGVRVPLKAVEIFGGYGICLDFPVQRQLRDLLIMVPGGGSNQVQRSIIAEELARAYRAP